MGRGRRLGIAVVAGLVLAMAATAEGQTQPPQSPRPRDDLGTDARLLADLEILRDLELLRQLDLLRRMQEVRGDPPARPAGTQEKGKP